MRLLPLALLLATLPACKKDKEEDDTGAGPDTGETGDSGETGDTGDTGTTAIEVNIVPRPINATAGEGTFTLAEGATIGADADLLDEAELLASVLRASTGYALPVSEGAGTITLRVNPKLKLPAEGYVLEASADTVTIDGVDDAGAWWGAQTLLQLLPPAVLSAEPVIGETWAFPAVRVADAPRFGYRSAMIDVARHFFGVEEIERQIDVMALHKLNHLHLHLTDDQGWRIEIKSWPDLTTIGGSTQVGGGPGGFYTQEDYSAIVAYAAARHVTVVPEIDFPGHSNAAMASYPELNESGVAADLYTGTGVISTCLWLDGPDTKRFVSDVWGEVAALTPGPYLHIGADEAVNVTDDQYVEFVGWIQGVVQGQGKTLLGWDEIGDVELKAPFAAQWWWDLDRALDSVGRGAVMVSSPAEHTYLDMMYDDQGEFGQVWAGLIDMEQAYSWDPAPRGLEDSSVLGVEGPLWTEYIDSRERLDFMLWPRLAAHAEVGWTSERAIDWEDARVRFGWDGARLEALGIGYYPTQDVDWVGVDQAE